jgi:hypothetical protein
MEKQDKNLPSTILSNFNEIVKTKGMTEDKVAEMLLQLCNWPTIKIDKNGVVHESIDGELRLKAIQLWCKVTGVLKTGSTEENHQHLHLENISEKKINELANKTK